jgi:hypothetical protein
MDAVCLLRGAGAGRAEALLALRHLPLPIRRDLISPDYERRRRAEGRFFEAILYELLRKTGGESSSIDRIAAWGADAPPPGESKKGIWYSRDGGIRICSAGAILAEVDLLFADSDGRTFFSEATITPPSPAAFMHEVERKRALLSDLAGGGEVRFLYISTTAPPQGLAPLFEDGGAVIVRSDLLPLVAEIEDVLGSPRKRRIVPHQKVVDGNDLFDTVPAVSEKKGLLSYIQRLFLK